ncbi:MAG TPA: Gfo/Idh/MocA family oxidoreductase [Bryobacteraceae bacterium]|nr:Gfo/Idh/MocA family oxidoreductase [Bryobacteraceae bacterium]
MARARRLLEAGAIGRPVFAQATNHGWFNAEDGFRAWLVDPSQSGGGPLRDIASHRIDLCNYLFGKPLRVTGQLSTLVQRIPVEDNATVLIEYETGVRAMVDVRWHSRVPRDEFRIRGTDVEIDLTPLNDPPLVSPSVTEQLPNHANIHYPCIAERSDRPCHRMGHGPCRSSVTAYERRRGAGTPACRVPTHRDAFRRHDSVPASPFTTDSNP